MSRDPKLEACRELVVPAGHGVIEFDYIDKVSSHFPMLLSCP